MMPMLKLHFLCCALSLAACTTAARIEYRTLVPAAPAQATFDAPLAIEMVPIGVPELVDRPQIVVRLPGEQGVRVLEQQRWASPLREEMRNALGFALSSRLNARDVYGIDRPELPIYRIAATVQRFETIIDGRSTLQAAWSVRAPDTDRLSNCQSTFQFATGKDIGSALTGYRHAIDELAQAISSVVRELVAGNQAGCPRAAGAVGSSGTAGTAGASGVAGAPRADQ